MHRTLPAGVQLALVEALGSISEGIRVLFPFVPAFVEYPAKGPSTLLSAAYTFLFLGFVLSMFNPSTLRVTSVSKQ